MAREIIEGDIHMIAMSNKEIVDLIGLLAATLVGVPLTGNACGAVPEIKVIHRGVILYRFLLCKDV